jgi:alkylation response protein AidB-like acyl-CoA dehydrogenase
VAAVIDAGLLAWLDEMAEPLDSGAADPAAILPRLAAAGLPGAGVPASLGGAGGDVTDAVEAVAGVSERSLSAGFVLWGHRTYIDYLLHTRNEALRRHLPDLIAGKVAGATGMSNAMKFLSGLEELQVTARSEGSGFVLGGRLPWVTNLRVQGFWAAVAVARSDAPDVPFCAALPHDLPGLTRSSDLDLMAMRAASTAALALVDAPIGPEHVLHPNAASWLPEIRPGFLGLQCGMSIGLARRALAEAGAHAGAARHVLQEPIAAMSVALAEHERLLREGLRSGAFRLQAAALFRLRIRLAEIVAEALSLELQALGGRAYLAGPGKGIARRLREATFVPLITPSLVQLKAALAAQETVSERVA